MKINLEPTGERVIEDVYMSSLGAYTIYAMHGASYRFVEALCTGKRILDLGCGSGYGSYRIAHHAEKVQAVDVSADAVSYARHRYPHPNLTFSQISPQAPLPFDDESFDVVLSFQVIEHVTDEDAYLLQAHRVLKPGGTLVVITPDRQHRLLPGQQPWNRWHIREYSQTQLNLRIARHFSIKRSLRMGAPWPVSSTEIRRYRRTKWLTLPVTLPFIPNRLRVTALNAIHAIFDKKHPAVAPAGIDYGFDETAFIIDSDPPYPMNLVVVAERG